MTIFTDDTNTSSSSQTPPPPPEKEQRYTLAQQLQDFPYAQVIVLMAVRVAEPVAFTSLFPYVFFMVKHLRPADDESSVARYAGYISGMFALCQALTGVVWGSASDRYGRKPILILGLLGSAVSLVWFGTATSFATALAARSLGGLLNGNVGVLRTALGEVAVHRRHQALAFSTMPLLWQVGCVVGPMVGGGLADPVKAHPGWFTPGSELEKTLSRHPFLLPNVVVGAMLVGSAVIAFLFLEEPHEQLGRISDQNDIGLKIGDAIVRVVTFGRVVRRRGQREEDSEEAGLLPTKKTDKYGTTIEVTEEPPVKMLDGPIIMTMIAYAVLSMTVTVVDELLPVLMSTSPSADNRLPFHMGGGLGMDSSQVGSMISVTGIFGIFIMIFLFPWIDGHFGTLRPFQLVSLLTPITYFLLPYLVFLASTPWSYTGGIIAFAAKTVLASLAFPQVLLLIQRTVTHRSYMGTINGLSQMFAAGARAVGPILWGYLMAWGQRQQQGWAPWWALAVASVVGLWCSLKLTCE